MTSSDTARRRVVVSSLLGTLAGACIFVPVLFNFTTNIGRSAVALRYASTFFELQATALIDGRLSLPTGSMGIEGFVMGDKTFMYFGPFPALLRIPILLVTHDFDGQLTVPSMLAAWVIFAVFAARLMWLLHRLLLPGRELGRLDAGLGAIVLAGVTGTTTLTFDGALPWAYHEVYLWQSALLSVAFYWMVRFVVDPSRKAVGWMGAMAMCVSLTRTTGGWAICLALFGLAFWIRRGKTFAGRRQWMPWVLAAGLIPFAAGIALNMYKFGHPYLFPLEHQVWTAVNEHRREALEINGGTITGPQFFASSFMAYFSPGGIRFVDYFPWITLPATAAREYAGAFLDQTYRTGSVTAFMPVHLLLTILAAPTIFRRTKGLPHGVGLRAVRLPAFAAVIMTGGVMNYGYIANRYTSEFVPALTLGALIATWTVLLPLARRARLLAVGTHTVLVLGFAFSAIAVVAVGFSAAALQFRGDPLERYLSVQDHLSGGPGSALAARITHDDSLPHGGHADDLHIRGDCDGLYINSGDRYEPWIAVEERAHRLSIRLDSPPPPNTRTTLFTITGNQPRSIELRTGRKGELWLAFINEDDEIEQFPFKLAPMQTMEVGLRTDSNFGYMELSSTPGGFLGYVPVQEWRADWQSEINTVTSPFDAGPVRSPATGALITPLPGLDLPLCTRLAEHNGIDLP